MSFIYSFTFLILMLVCQSTSCMQRCDVFVGIGLGLVSTVNSSIRLSSHNLDFVLLCPLLLFQSCCQSPLCVNVHWSVDLSSYLACIL